MNPLLSLIAILPGLIIAYLIYRTDKYEPEALRHLVLCFALGMLITIPSMYLESWGATLGWEESGHLGLLFLFSVIVVGFSEEITKYLGLVLYPYQRPFFNEPMDGIVYAVMIGMGFATLENLLYADRYGMDTIVIRAFTAVPAHGVFAVISGYYVGLAKFNPHKKYRYLFLGLFWPILLHAIYDFFILQNAFEWMMSFATLTLVFGGYWGWILIKRHRNNSPFKPNPPNIAITDKDVGK